jgi:hypothetical protein
VDMMTSTLAWLVAKEEEEEALDGDSVSSNSKSSMCVLSSGVNMLVPICSSKLRRIKHKNSVICIRSITHINPHLQFEICANKVGTQHHSSQQ